MKSLTTAWVWILYNKAKAHESCYWAKRPISSEWRNEISKILVKKPSMEYLNCFACRLFYSWPHLSMEIPSLSEEGAQIRIGRWRRPILVIVINNVSLCCSNSFCVSIIFLVWFSRAFFLSSSIWILILESPLWNYC